VTKKKYLKSSKRAYKGRPIKLDVGFSAEAWQARREWNDVFKVPIGKNLQPRIFYPVRL